MLGGAIMWCEIRIISYDEKRYELESDKAVSNDVGLIWPINKRKLETPTNLRVRDGYVLEWDNVDYGADSYILIMNVTSDGESKGQRSYRYTKRRLFSGKKYCEFIIENTTRLFGGTR